VNREQLKTILWLRWRLTRNQWSRSGGLGAVIAAIVAIGACVLGGASFVGALLGGIFGLGEAKPLVVLGVWFALTVAFLFLWTLGLLQELQRSETIDLQRLMHLPVALGQMFIINYLASHLSLSIFLFVPAMMGLAIGLVVSRGPAMMLLLPLALSMVLMITAWTYCLRGWLATLMSNPRRRRAVIMGITLTFILLAQGPNLYFNVIRRHAKPPPATTPEAAQRQRQMQKQTEAAKLDQLLAIQKFIPPLWLPVGARALAEGHILPAMLGTLGCFALGALGLRRAYRGTVRFYHGETTGKMARSVKPDRIPNASPTPARDGSRFLELPLPGVPEQAAALALATLRSMLRAPEVKMAWGTSFVVSLILGVSVLFRSAPNMSEAVKPFIATGAVVFSILMLVQFLANQFGFDRDGFRALILSPADRRLILLGKNIACLPVGIAFSVMLQAFIFVWLHLPLLVLLAALFQLASLLLLAGVLGNLLSILVPYRIQPGSMKPTKMPALAMLAMVVCQMLFPMAMLPAFLPALAGWLWQRAGWPDLVPVNCILSVAMAGLTGLLYWKTLEPLGRLLQRRETKILGVVTVEVD
jgi:ABC-2 type transport system permease protein